MASMKVLGRDERWFWPDSPPLFDFTFKFEETILQIVPSSSFIVFASASVFYYFQKNARIRASALLWAKLCLALAIIALELVNLVLRRLYGVHTETTYPAASLDFAAAFAIAIVVCVEHRYAIRTSAWLGLYLSIGVLIDATKSRSYFLRGLVASGTVSAVTGAVRLLLVVLEEVPKTNLIIDPGLRTISDGEATSGFYGRIFFFFLTPLLRMGYQGVLKLDDLSDLSVEFAAQRLFSELQDQWPASKYKSKNAFFYACFKAWKWPFCLMLFPRLCVTGFKYSKPFLMQSIIGHISKPNDDAKAGLIGGVVLVFLGNATFQGISSHLRNRLITRIRGGLISSLFHKCYRLKLPEGKKQAAITMMSADFESITLGLPACIDIPFAVLEAGLGTFFLSRFIKIDCLILFGPLVATLISGHMFGTRSSTNITRWNAATQTRVARTSHVLSQLPAIKSLGLGPQMARYIQSLQIAETKASKTYRTLQAITIGSAVLVDHFTPVLVVAVGVFTYMFGEELDPEIIYPALGVVTMAKGPLATLLQVYPQFMSMLGCFERIQVYLSQDEHEDPRIVSGSGLATTQERPILNGLQLSPGQIAGLNPLPIFRFENATIASSGSDKAVLSNLDFCLDEGSITAMFGPTGSGKSTVVEGMLGEAEVLEGKTHVVEPARRIAVCGQQVFLPNGTFRDCIVGACEYEPVWFNTVIAYCKLLEDLERLPNGELYNIGTGGVGLSGGQRQRVGIARSVYARTKLIIFDDSLSSLDKKTAIEILNGLCGEEGLLRQLNCTVVISSYLAECIDIADNLILLDGNGNASFEKANSGGKVRAEVTLLLRQGLLGEREQGPEAEEEEEEEESTNASDEKAIQPAAAIEEPDKSRQRGDSGLYMLWIDAVGRLTMALFLLLMIGVAISDAMPNIYVRIWVELGPSDKKYLIGYALVAIASGVFAALGLLMMFCRLAPRSINVLHDKLIIKTTQASLGYLTVTDSGELLNRYSEDMALLSKRVPTKMYSTVYSIFGLAAYLPTIFAGATYMIASLPVIGFLLYLLQQYYLRTSRQLRLIEIEAQAPLVAALRDIGNGVLYFRAFGSQGHDFNRCLKLLENSQKPFYLLLASQVFLTLVLDIIVMLMTLALTLMALYWKNTTSPNATGLALLNMISLGTGLSMVINAWTLMEAAVGSLNRLRRFLRDTPTENVDGTPLPAAWPSRGEVVFDNVVARYNVDNKTKQPAVLHGVQLRIEPGKKIGIMGRTGSGKTSLLRSLLGFLEYKGKITIDGVDVKTANPDELRSRIITISQELVELDGTIRDNLLPFDKSWDEEETRPLDEKERQEAERKDQIVVETLVRLGIWDQLLPKGGLDALLSKADYSFGEKQLFCIARAVVRKRLTGSKLVLVDEATASIDSWREQTVREMMVEYFKGCTIIVVAHREESIADSHRTVHMARGLIDHVDIYDQQQG
ncbi:hypothetical protein NLG97_g2449 [Lecanicillium saksenae]|uniref:Uncharacterized protein n=1 Tax=Lecanicillium saksenae TaxID=468837 RepID=A0ACC1R2N3_9HYPO|nr:hypothetical protein NLG97_g2449 [Lecanicillium saksenae]